MDMQKNQENKSIEIHDLLLDIEDEMEIESEKKVRDKKISLSETDRQIVISTFKNPIQSAEIVQKFLQIYLKKEFSIKYLKKLLSQLHKAGYLHYNSSANLIRSTSRGKKLVLSLLDSWMESSRKKEKILIKENPGIQALGVSLAKLDLLFSQLPSYTGYYASFQYCMESREPVPQMTLENFNVLKADAIYLFQTTEKSICFFMFLLKNLPVHFLTQIADRELPDLLEKFNASPVSALTAQKIEKISGVKFHDYGTLIVSPTTERKEHLQKILGNVATVKGSFLLSMQDCETCDCSNKAMFYNLQEKNNVSWNALLF